MPLTFHIPTLVPSAKHKQRRHAVIGPGGFPFCHLKALKKMQEVDVEEFRAIEAYDWAHDPQYQSGLGAMLSDTTTAEQAEDFATQAKVFHWQKLKGIEIDFCAFKQYLDRESAVDKRSSSPAPALAVAKPEDAPYPPTFAEMVSLIANNQPIPGIREIPPTVLQNQGTEPSAPRRLKPWEVAARKKAEENGEQLDEQDNGQTNEGTFGDSRDQYIAQEYPDDD